MHLICFSRFYSLIYLLLIFLEHKSHRYSEIKPECNWHYHKASSSTNDYSGQHDKSYYQPATYNENQQYRHDRTTLRVPSRNVHGREKLIT